MDKTGICVEKFDEMHLEFLLTKMKGMILSKPDSLGRILPWLSKCEEKNINLSPLLMRSLSDTLKKIAKNNVNKEGELIIKCQVSRSQEQNLESSYEKLRPLIWEASIQEKERIIDIKETDLMQKEEWKEGEAE